MMCADLTRLKSLSLTKSTACGAVVGAGAFEETKGSRVWREEAAVGASVSDHLRCSVVLA